ncbi:hydroxyethylthiazole kinase [Planococcus shenhongbingii]|uniref:hydroxyethylthiazole kinase n=1 Tax=Planococcus shenhongbingii TaxID=3058398 RepID=UPI002611E7D0|nr:hydroxyethylthiazole kinase [Planococcus sp. N016]WKA58204.1 hydroxyethylthiazole kinase [Planococcus sp. N016]
MLGKLRSEKPIIHCITNHVVSNFQANGLLALGASPIMGEAPEEAAELAALADAVSLNIGTLNSQSLNSMLIAGKKANALGVPVVLDPVGVGATAFRAAAANKILTEVNVAVLRCNAGELAAIAGADWQAKGVDAGEGEADIHELARNTAKRLKLIVAVSGELDIITDGKRLAEIPFGHRVMASVTGTGCLLSSVVAAFLTVHPEDSFEAAAAAMRYYAIAGEQASAHSELPGDFQTAFLNQMNAMGQNDIDDVIRQKEGVPR